MEFYNRRLLLLNEDEPISTIFPLPHLQHTEPTTAPATNSSSTSMFERPLELSQRPVFSSSFSYTFLILFITLLFLGFVLLYIRQFAGDSSGEASSRRRNHSHNSHTSSCGGVDPTTVKSLPVFSYDGDGEEEVDCAICLEVLEEADRVKMIPYCKHVFHPECIDTWLISHVTCPICRCSKFLSKGEEEGGSSVNNSIHDALQRGSMVENGRGVLHDNVRTSTSISIPA